MQTTFRDASGLLKACCRTRLGLYLVATEQYPLCISSSLYAVSQSLQQYPVELKPISWHGSALSLERETSSPTFPAGKGKD